MEFGFISILGALLPSVEGISLLVPAGRIPGGHDVQSGKGESMLSPHPEVRLPRLASPTSCVCWSRGEQESADGRGPDRLQGSHRLRKRFPLPLDTKRPGLCPPAVPQPVITEILTCVQL